MGIFEVLIMSVCKHGSDLDAVIVFFSLLFFGLLMYLHWEAMLVSYLSTRVIVLPFKDITGLVDSSNFRISLIPGSSYEDAFKYATAPDWQKAWTTRVKPYLEEYVMEDHLIKLLVTDQSMALYDNYFATM